MGVPKGDREILAEWLAVARRLVRFVLIVAGLLVTGYGLLYFLRGWPYGLGLLWMCSAFGLQMVGLGMLLSSPVSIWSSLVSGITLLVSAVLFLALWITSPLNPGFLVFLAISGVGALLALILFRRRPGR
jgi:hypothetical protein